MSCTVRPAAAAVAPVFGFHDWSDTPEVHHTLYSRKHQKRRRGGRRGGCPGLAGVRRSVNVWSRATARNHNSWYRYQPRTHAPRVCPWLCWQETDPISDENRTQLVYFGSVYGERVTLAYHVPSHKGGSEHCSVFAVRLSVRLFHVLLHN